MRTCPHCKRTFADGFSWCPFDATPLQGGALAELLETPTSAGPTEAPTSADLPPYSDGNALAALQDRFDIRGKLGQGGMATVFHAVERSAGVDVAIKVMNHIMARKSPERKRFLREAEMMVPIRHENIMPIFAFGQLPDGSPYLVMQYMDGETLGGVVRRSDPIDRPSALRIAKDAAAGLACAHDEGIVHRDVKPDNIFLVGSPERIRMVRLLDFGLGRLYGATGLTASGIIMGTPEYMAPEQTVNDPVGPRTDIYALGVVLYRMLAGALPFKGKETELLAAHLTLPPPPLYMSAWGADVSPGLEKVVAGALRKVPRNRYASMHDLWEDLERAARGEADAIVGPPLLCDDVYIPQSAFGLSVARILWKKAGVAPPA